MRSEPHKREMTAFRCLSVEGNAHTLPLALGVLGGEVFFVIHSDFYFKRRTVRRSKHGNKCARDPSRMLQENKNIRNLLKKQ